MKSMTDRGVRLQALRAFGLYVKGMNAREIAQLFEAQENVRYEGNDVYPMLQSAWRLVAARCPGRWPQRIRHSGLGWLKGHRELPAPIVVEPPRDIGPLERLLIRLEDVERFARDGGFHDCADGLRNMRAAVVYNWREKQKAKRQA